MSLVQVTYITSFDEEGSKWETSSYGKCEKVLQGGHLPEDRIICNKKAKANILWEYENGLTIGSAHCEEHLPEELDKTKHCFGNVFGDVTITKT